MGLLCKKKMSKGGVPYSEMEESKRPNMSEGGSIFKKTPRNSPSEHEKGVNKASSQLDPGTSVAGVHVMAEDSEGAKWRHKKSLQELKKMKNPKLLAHGGEADYQPSCDSNCNQPCEVHEMGEDLVGQVLAKRMSKGGMLANEKGPGVDGLPNEFDDLALRDNLEFSDTGANSGDEDGDSSLFEDTVSKVMLKRRKQHNPRPA